MTRQSHPLVSVLWASVARMVQSVPTKSDSRYVMHLLGQSIGLFYRISRCSMLPTRTAVHTGTPLMLMVIPKRLLVNGVLVLSLSSLA